MLIMDKVSTSYKNIKKSSSLSHTRQAFMMNFELCHGRSKYRGCSMIGDMIIPNHTSRGI